MDFNALVQKQKEYFLTGATLPVKFRKDGLEKLRKALLSNEPLINEALKKDMNKCPEEVFMTETGMVLSEINYHLKHLSNWTKKKRVITPLAQFSAKSYILPQPYGTALIMSPWNYPLLLTLSPLTGAISAGCTAVVKPSAYAPNTSAAIAKILSEIYPSHYIAAVEGGRQENAQLLDQHFDYIFFTGSAEVGKSVMAGAAKHLTPVTLELGGKSPVIVDESADIALAAKRIAFGKVLNGGQTCIAPDYLFIHQSVKEAFIAAYAKAIEEFFPCGDMSGMNVIINEKHYNRLTALLDSGKAVIGGQTDPARRFIAPALLDDVSLHSPIMQEEIFGPILPVIPYGKIEECIQYITSHPKPLALYLFTSQKSVEQRIMNTCSFGGGCVNDTIIHIATPYMAFGGVGASGMGSYHGKKSFDTFTHYRSIVNKANWIDMPIRYRPYTKSKSKLIRKFLK